MNNRNRGPASREPGQADRHSTYSTSSYGSGYGAGQQGEAGYDAGRERDAAGLYGGRQGAPRYQDRDVQQARHDRGREGSYPQAMARDDFSERADYVGFASSSPAGRRAAGLRSDVDRGYDDQDFSQDYNQGSSHYGSQGFGAQGSQGVYGPQGFGSQGGIGARGGEHGPGSSGYGGYSQEGYGSASQSRGYTGDPWRARDVTGQGLGARAGGYRGLGPKNYTRPDERIRDDLNERLTDSDEIDASNLSVEVNSGVATLTGTVAQRWMKHRAEDLAESCSGVRDVNNQIRVSPAQPYDSGRATGASTSPGGGASDLGHSSGAGSSASAGTATSSMSSSPASAGSTSTGGRQGGTNRSSGSSGLPPA